MKKTNECPPCCLLLAACISISFLTACQKETSTETTNANISASSPIVYTDINPDITLVCTPGPGKISSCSNSYSLDLNNDGIIDFSIAYSYSLISLGIEGQRKTTIAVKITCNNQNAVAVDSVYPLALNLNENISQGLKWKPGSTLTLNYSYQSCGLGCNTLYNGNWFSTTDKMLGLKLIKSGKIFYSWVLLSGNARTIRSYAFNSVSNQSILAGQTK